MLCHLVTVLGLVALTRGAGSGDWNYNVTIYTGTEAGAGKYANVHIWIYGDDVAEYFILNFSTRNQDAFENGQVDEFLVKLHPLGRIKKIIVGNDGSHSFSGWSFKQLVIKERSSGCTTMFVCECWINGQKKTLFPKEVTSCGTETDHTETPDVTTVFTTATTAELGSSSHCKYHGLLLAGIIVAGFIFLAVIVAMAIMSRKTVAVKDEMGRQDGRRIEQQTTTLS